MAAQPIREWTREEIIDFVESQARALRNMSAAELWRAYAAGALESPGEVIDLLSLLDLLADDDPVTAPA